jgi:arylsulfatase A-like enzyme
MFAKRAIVLVIDRLGAGWLGPYGNTWLDTPNFNRLAARSALIETAIADSPDLATSCRGYFTGRHLLEPGGEKPWSLPASLGGSSLLLTDEPQIAAPSLAAGFGKQRLLPAGTAPRAAEEIEHTRLYQFFDAARTAVCDADAPPLVWLHSTGMSAAWDAPLALRYQFADEDDPQPPDFVEPPERMLPKEFDPDELLGLVHAYAGQVALVDMCLGMLLDALDEHPQARETLLLVTSPRGYPLGEHRRIGPCDQALYGELLHVPLLLRMPGEVSPSRYQTIVQPHELSGLLAAAGLWQAGEAAGPNQRSSQRSSRLFAELQGEPVGPATVAYAGAAGQRAIRTPAWFLRQWQTPDGPQNALFAKPDDRWEANEIASRCTEEVAGLAAHMDEFEAAAQSGRLAELPPLAEILSEVWR